jgi:hypothetical protein
MNYPREERATLRGRAARQFVGASSLAWAMPTTQLRAPPAVDEGPPIPRPHPFGASIHSCVGSFRKCQTRRGPAITLR